MRLRDAVQNENFMRNFRWITPLAVSVCAIATTVLIAVQSYLVFEIRDTKRSATEYTDKMIRLISTHSHPEFTTRNEFNEVRQEISIVKEKVNEVDKKLTSVRTLLLRKPLD